MKRLNQLRIDAGYSIIEIAHLMGVDETTACCWLSGTLEPDEVQRALLAAILQVGAHDLDDDATVIIGRLARLKERLMAAGVRVGLL